jgi:hypothetical protein
MRGNGLAAISAGKTILSHVWRAACVVMIASSPQAWGQQVAGQESPGFVAIEASEFHSLSSLIAGQSTRANYGRSAIEAVRESDDENVRFSSFGFLEFDWDPNVGVPGFGSLPESRAQVAGGATQK